MTDTIIQIIKNAGLIVCPGCDGSGEIDTFCGHYSLEVCYMCDGHGVIKSLKKQKHRKTCFICNGNGGIGCCNDKGFHEWESYELYDNNKNT